MIIAFDYICHTGSSSSVGTKGFLELFMNKIGDEKVKAEMIVNLLRNFCSEIVCTPVPGCSGSLGLGPPSQHSIISSSFTARDLRRCSSVKGGFY